MEHMGPRIHLIKPNYIYIYYACERWDFAGDSRPRLTPSSSCLWFQVSEQSERLWYHPPSGNQTGQFGNQAGQLKIHHSWMIFPFKPPFIGGFQLWCLITRGYHVLSSPRFSNSMATEMSNTCDAPHTQCPFHDLPPSKHYKVVFRLMWVCQKIGHNIWYLFITVLRKQKTFGRVGGV